MDYHTSPHAMARVLVQYMRSNLAIQREIEASLGVRMHVSVIAELRGVYERSANKWPRDFERSVVWMDERFEKNMDAANRSFVAALLNAKAA